MTGQDLLDRMELLNQELQNQAGEANVTKSLLALNVAQDYFESLASLRGKLFGSSVGTVATTANTETTTFPTGVLRIDRLQLLDASSRVEAELLPLRRAGGHGVASFWPLNLISTTSSGKPRAYWTNGTAIYWSPVPIGVYTIRYYGFAGASNITASGTFAYPDIVALPLASFAVRLVKSGLDDSDQAIGTLANDAFAQTLDSMSLFNRDGAVGFEYTEIHDT